MLLQTPFPSCWWIAPHQHMSGNNAIRCLCTWLCKNATFKPILGHMCNLEGKPPLGQHSSWLSPKWLRNTLSLDAHHTVFFWLNGEKSTFEPKIFLYSSPQLVWALWFMLVVVEWAAFDLKPPIALENTCGSEQPDDAETFLISPHHFHLFSGLSWEVSQRDLCLARLTAQHSVILQYRSKMLGEG